MGMSEAEFYQTTPRYFYNRQKAWQRQRDADLKRQENWHRWHLELHRSGYLTEINLQVDKMHRMKPHDFFPLPWDEKPEQVTTEDLKKWVEETGLMEIPIDQF